MILLTRGYLKIVNNCVAVDTLKQHWQEAKLDVFLLSKCNAYGYNGGKVGKLDPKKSYTTRIELFITQIMYHQPCMRIVSKMDRAISDLVAKISSNSTAGHTREDMVNRVLRRFVAIQASIKFNSDSFSIYSSWEVIKAGAGAGGGAGVSRIKARAGAGVL